jgi:hypothetical protein
MSFASEYRSRQHRFDAAFGTHPGVAILHMELPGQRELVAEPGQELFVVMGAEYPCAERPRVSRQAFQYRLERFEARLGEDSLEPLLT